MCSGGTYTKPAIVTMLVCKPRQKPNDVYILWACVWLEKEDTYAEIGSGCQVFVSDV